MKGVVNGEIIGREYFILLECLRMRLRGQSFVDVEKRIFKLLLPTKYLF